MMQRCQQVQSSGPGTIGWRRTDHQLQGDGKDRRLQLVVLRNIDDEECEAEVQPKLEAPDGPGLQQSARSARS